MSSQSDIIVERSDGSWARIYCHNDGELNGVGRTLFVFYNLQERAETLMVEGDLSVLAERCDKPNGHSYDKPVKGYSIYYGRDRHEKATEAMIGDNLTAVWPNGDTGSDLTYVWQKDSGWWVGKSDTGITALSSLKDVLADVPPEVKVPYVQSPKIVEAKTRSSKVVVNINRK